MNTLCTALYNYDISRIIFVVARLKKEL